MSQSTVAVIDYGMGNLHSVGKALEHVAPDSEVIITADHKTISEADRVVFPGVGAIRDCMAEIKKLHVDEFVREAIATKPVLAICVGLQALMEYSEENGGVDCIGLLPGQVKFFGTDHYDSAGVKLKVPHMGWNQVHQTIDHPMWHNIDQDSRFYFVHSYYVNAEDKSQIAGTCEYGTTFSAALFKDNLFAVQFHPEKSHKTGLQLLENFMHWNGHQS
ncbi:MAG: imidazole glycerol phosphate synthase subunit HisH [Pseudomonadales bacterium]|nr:imidazole glycerol phosphate synthase subunit HisH [Pseudomonadales bacterium]